jgi:uncharacterized protein
LQTSNKVNRQWWLTIWVGRDYKRRNGRVISNHGTQRGLCELERPLAMINLFTRRAIAIAAVAGVGILVGLATITTLAQSNDGASAVTHKIAIQVNQNDKAVMDLALNNAKNVIDYYKSKGEKVAVEIVTYGPGLHMLRADTSPVKDRIAVMSLENANVTFAACGNTQANQSKAENKPVVLISEAKVTPSGVVRLMELQKQGYAYLRP